MSNSSEYTFPIFISSTDYNLKDLRAELARFLSELGYKPILSSAEGFPDSSPILEPWESCLPVLEKSFVMVLIIDGRYGNPLSWKNYDHIITSRKVSPTHGEYILAHTLKKRMLVFIRRELMPHYQSYRATMKRFKNDKIKSKEILLQTLPENIDYDTLEFINEVKTTKPIPWINEFDDITSVKKEIQKKMLNELAELFLIKNKHFETVIDSFNKVMDSMSLEEQKKTLSKINATKEFNDAVDQLEKYKNEIATVSKQLEESKTEGEDARSEYQQKIKVLNKKISDLETSTLKSSDSQFFLQDGQVKIGNPNYTGSSVIGLGGTSVIGGSLTGTFSGINGGLSGNGVVITGSSLMYDRCDKCGHTEYNPVKLTGAHLYANNRFNRCTSCERLLCNVCWPKPPRAITSTMFNTLGVNAALDDENKCPDCVKARK